MPDQAQAFYLFYNIFFWFGFLPNHQTDKKKLELINFQLHCSIIIFIIIDISQKKVFFFRRQRNFHLRQRNYLNLFQKFY